MSRQQTRAAFFGYLLGRTTSGEQERMAAALKLLEPEYHAVLYEAHGGGDRESVDWAAEQAAVDRLGEILDLLSPRRAVAA